MCCRSAREGALHRPANQRRHWAESLGVFLPEARCVAALKRCCFSLTQQPAHSFSQKHARPERQRDAPIYQRREGPPLHRRPRNAADSCLRVFLLVQAREK